MESICVTYFYNTADLLHEVEMLIKALLVIFHCILMAYSENRNSYRMQPPNIPVFYETPVAYIGNI